MKQTEKSSLMNKIKFLISKYDNIFIAADLNVDTEDKSNDANNHLCEFMDTLPINNLIKIETCYKNVLLQIFCNKDAFLYDSDQNLIQEKFYSQKKFL